MDCKGQFMPKESWSYICEPCETVREDRLQAQRAAAEFRRIEAERKAFIPPRYREIDPAHPGFNARLWEAVQSWEPTEEQPWLGLIGAPGIGKTRCGYHKLWALSRPKDVRPYAVTACEFTQLCGFQSSKADATKSRKDLNELLRCSFLFLDDLGKVKTTPAVVHELFGLLDVRLSRNRIMIWTANRPVEDFAQAWGEEYREPMAGRLLEGSVILMG